MNPVQHKTLSKQPGLGNMTFSFLPPHKDIVFILSFNSSQTNKHSHSNLHHKLEKFKYMIIMRSSCTFNRLKKIRD